MKRYLVYFTAILTLFFSLTALAKSNNLSEERILTVEHYMVYLQARETGKIIDLFVPGGMVESTSQSLVTAQQFFSSFLPTLESANVTNRNIADKGIQDHLQASFYFEYKPRGGKQEAGSFTDDFYFAPGSEKIAKVIMRKN